jgi:hypothetical protein
MARFDSAPTSPTIVRTANIIAVANNSHVSKINASAISRLHQSHAPAKTGGPIVVAITSVRRRKRIRRADAGYLSAVS